MLLTLLLPTDIGIGTPLPPPAAPAATLTAQLTLTARAQGLARFPAGITAVAGVRPQGPSASDADDGAGLASDGPTMAARTSATGTDGVFLVSSSDGDVRAYTL